ncbi:hypothetical protein [Roseomonas genomospecies 6]|uniref:Uncharacterized protein n=1 Tax=Roseomonas genomospecies 6 TaxID=214106 RepID=A0A9W7KPL8_9PROT|nr:hypothetical protein [Roseomonas genomospecies 6]KAA0676994.1 hypothetical protein DS843_25300 [Roseomonas genomospecies 6]
MQARPDAHDVIGFYWTYPVPGRHLARDVETAVEQSRTIALHRDLVRQEATRQGGRVVAEYVYEEPKGRPTKLILDDLERILRRHADATVCWVDTSMNHRWRDHPFLHALTVVRHRVCRIDVDSDNELIAHYRQHALLKAVQKMGDLYDKAGPYKAPVNKQGQSIDQAALKWALIEAIHRLYSHIADSLGDERADEIWALLQKLEVPVPRGLTWNRAGFEDVRRRFARSYDPDFDFRIDRERTRSHRDAAAAS